MKHFKIKFLSAGNADSIVISYKNIDNQPCHIILDSGEKNNFQLLKQELESLPHVNLLVITHIDNDHIGGLSELVNDATFFKKCFIQSCWFNAYSKIKQPQQQSGLIGVKEGILLRDVLSQKLDIDLPFITTQTTPLDLCGAKLTVLSPDLDSLKKMLMHWQVREPIGAKQSDYQKTIEELAQRKPPRFDNSTVNRSSIAFLFEYENVKILLLADSNPSVIVASLRALDYSETQKLTVDYMKVSHHGSRYNTSPELLSFIDCRQFIFTADGLSNPDKVVLARIITHYYEPDNAPIKLIFTDKTTNLENIFSVDKNPFERWNFTVEYPTVGQNAYIIEH